MALVNIMKGIAETAINVKTAVPRLQARVAGKAAKAVGAEKIGAALEKAGARIQLNEGGQPVYKNGEMPQAGPN
mgnify:CR=1 FL=1|tara:strand:+ start:242 stop:463 length:222 start_codon:yes stop_codon:yes gene_type:complete